MFVPVFLVFCSLLKFCNCVCTEKSFENISVSLPNEKCYANDCIDENLCNFDKVEELVVIDSRIEILRKGAVKNLPKLSELLFVNNKLQYIHTEAFINLPKLAILRIRHNLNKVDKIFDNLEQLKYLTLVYNEITIIKNEALTNANLNRLELDNNKLTSLRSEIFKSSLNNLHYLSVKKNNIDYIDPNFFDYIPNLITLHLSNNRITHLSSKSALNNIQTLSLEGNQLMYLEPQLTEKLTKLKTINIDLNPWICLCYFEVINWINVRPNALVTEDGKVPFCVSPRIKLDKCQYETDEEARNYFNEKLMLYNSFST